MFTFNIVKCLTIKPLEHVSSNYENVLNKAVSLLLFKLSVRSLFINSSNTGQTHNSAIQEANVYD